MVASCSSFALPSHEATFFASCPESQFWYTAKLSQVHIFFLRFSIKTPLSSTIGRLTCTKPCVECLYLKVLKINPYEVQLSI